MLLAKVSSGQRRDIRGGGARTTTPSVQRGLIKLCGQL